MNEQKLEPVINNLATFPARGDKTVGKLLIEAGKLKLQDVEAIERCQKERGLRFGEAAVELGLVQETDIVQMLARQFDYPYLQAGEGGYSPQLIAAYQPFGSEVETLRKLRSQLVLRWFNAEQKALAVAGVDGGEEARLLAANLAVVFSQLGEKTVLVDANLREPRQQSIFNLARRQGLSDLLAGRCGMEAIVKLPGFVDLSVLPSGTVPPNPQELLGRPAFAALLRDLARSFDIILLDTPPAALYADAQNIAAEAKGAVLVMRKHQTRVADAEVLKKELMLAKAETVGAVLIEP
jgi:chain length determinant protein tyrosine kinase EpsG